MEKNTVQVKQCFDKCYPDSALSRKMVEKRFAEFKRFLVQLILRIWLPAFTTCLQT